MATSGSGQVRIEDVGGLLVVREPVEPAERPAPGARLRTALQELDERQGAESRRLSESRRLLGTAIQAKTEERSLLLRQVDDLKIEIEDLREQLRTVPDEASERARRTSDRLAAFGRVLRTEIHLVNEMLNAFAEYTRERRSWQDDVDAAPELEESRQLVHLHAQTPEAISELPEVLRGIVERQLESAIESLAALGEPLRPVVVAPIYECVAPAPQSGSTIAVAVPVSCDSLGEGHPHGLMVAQLLAAVSQALLEETDADAPVLICPGDGDPLAGTVLVGATCTTDALDADLFGVRLQELLSRSHLIGVEVQPVEDAELAAGLVAAVDRKAQGR